MIEKQSGTPVSTKTLESKSRKENIAKMQNGTPKSTPMKKKSVLSLAKKQLKRQNGTPSTSSKPGNCNLVLSRNGLRFLQCTRVNITK